MPSRARKDESVETEEHSQVEESMEEEVKSEKKQTKTKSNSKKPMKKASKTSSAKTSSAKTGSKMTGGSMKGKSMKGGSKKVEETSENDDDYRRYFKLIREDGTTHGRYTGDTPKQAASKSYTKMVQKLRKDGSKIPKSCIIYIRESTRHSPRKIYGYQASRQKLDVPQKLPIKDKLTGKPVIDKKTGEPKVITYRYRNKIQKVQVDMEQFGGLNKKSTKKKTDTKKKTESVKKTSMDKKKTESVKKTSMDKKKTVKKPVKSQGSKSQSSRSQSSRSQSSR